MKTLSAAAKPVRQTSRPGTGAGLPKWVACGPDRRMSREEILAEDALFLSRMKRGAKAAQGAVALVREGR